MAKRRPKALAPSAAARHGKAQAPPSTQHENPVFGFRHAQVSCDPRWAFRPSGEDAGELLEFMRQMALITWGEIEQMRHGGNARHRKHHECEVSRRWDASALADLEKHCLSEIFGETLFRFRLSGVKRLWGYREGATFHVVWWDPNHKVYPTAPD